MIYRSALALLCGTGFACLLTLLLGLSSSALLSVPLIVLLTPGGILADLVIRPQELSPPMVVVAANSLIYSMVAYGAVFLPRHRPATEKMRIATMRLVLPVAVLVGLVCIPKLNPMWPHGMAELTLQEKALQDALPVGAGLVGTRDVLRAKGISFDENTEADRTVVLNGGNGMSIVAAPGDLVISARIPTEARAFICSYDIQIVLLFGTDQRMRQQYIHRLRLCP